MEVLPIEIMNSNSDLLVYSGSHLFGTNVPESDIDLRGVYMPSLTSFLGVPDVDKSRGHADFDISVHPFSSFVQFLKYSKHNFVNLLWTPEEYIIKKHPAFDPLFENRDIFITNLYFRHLLNHFKGAYISVEKYAQKNNVSIIPGNSEHSKQAMHVVRLGKMVSEILTHKSVILRRPDAESLKDIRIHGIAFEQLHYIFDSVLSFVDAQDLDDIFDLFDCDKVRDIVVQVGNSYYGEGIFK